MSSTTRQRHAATARAARVGARSSGIGTARRVLLGVVLVVIASAGFGSVPVLAKLAYGHGGSPEAVLSARYAFAALALALPIAAACRTGVRRPTLPLVPLLAAGASNVVANVTYWIAVDRDAVTRVAPLVYVFPALVAALSALLGRERLGAEIVAGVVLGIGGAVLVVGGTSGAPADPVATGLALAAAARAAVFFFAARSALRHSGWLSVAFSVFVISAVSIGALAAVQGASLPRDATGWALMGTTGVLCTALPYWLWLIGLRLIGETRTALLAVCEPAVAVVLALLLLGERLGAVQALGVACVLLSVLAPNLRFVLASRR